MDETTITRRTLLKMAALGGTAAGLSGLGLLPGMDASAFAAEAPTTLPIVKTPGFSGTPPNIILINCDDLGYGDLGCYGNTVIRTPQVDRLAGEGVRFTDFNACASICTPSRYGLLSGRYPIRAGMIYVMLPAHKTMATSLNRGLWRWLGQLGAVDMRDESYVNGLPDKELTMAAALRVAGYRTGMVGKWHLGDFSREPRYNPCRHGFDSFFGLPHSNDLFPCALYRNEACLEADIGRHQARLTGLYTREAVDFIQKDKTRPFFLYLAHTFPHQPLYASEGFKDRSKAGIYGDAVEELDWSVGEILAGLKENRLEDNTMVLFTSDNGPWYNGSTGGLRGRKGQSHEGGYRVPLIVRWPGKIPAGNICREAAMNIDFFPTFLALAGLALPSDRIIDGKNILGLLTGKETKTPHEALYFYHQQELEGVRAGHWKYFRDTNHYVWPMPVDKHTTFLGKGDKGTLADWPNLYDLSGDSAECYNLAQRYPEVCARLEQLMRQWEAEIARNPGGWLRE